MVIMRMMGYPQAPDCWSTPVVYEACDDFNLDVILILFSPEAGNHKELRPD